MNRPQSSILLVLVMALAGWGCGDERTRPELTGLSSDEVSLSAGVVGVVPEDGPYIAGRQVEATVHGSEEGERLRAVGVTLRGPLGDLLHEDRVGFPLTESREHTFVVDLPEGVPDNTRVLLTAVAEAADGSRAVSEPRELHVLHCPPNAAWCE